MLPKCSFFIILGYIINYCPYAHEKEILTIDSLPKLLDLEKKTNFDRGTCINIPVNALIFKIYHNF